MPLVTIIGRGHSGTRAISQTLYASGIYMGATLNRSGDLFPPQDMYEACRVLARDVAWQGGLEWDFSRLHTMDIPSEFTELLERYLASVLTEHVRKARGVGGLEDTGNDARLSVDCTALPRNEIYLLDPRSA